MHTIDILFGIAAVFFIVTGVRRGLVGEVFRLFALIAGVAAGFIFYPEVAVVFHFSNQYVSNALAFIVLFLIAALIVLGFGWVIKKIIHLTPLGWIDYLFGGAIGLVKALFIFWVICLSFASFPATVKKMKVNNSIVFAAYKKLPAGVKLDAMLKLRDIAKKNVDKKFPEQVKQTEKKIETLKNSVDSLKQAENRRRR